MVSIILLYRIHKAVDDKAYIVDVDGSYLYKSVSCLKNIVDPFGCSILSSIVWMGNSIWNKCRSV